MIPVISSNITHIGYDPATQYLKVLYKSGLYHYKQVEPEHWIQLQFAIQNQESVGSYLSAHIKGNYEYERIKTEEESV